MALPVVKWLGGKRQLLHAIKERLPLKYGKYFEPFFGGGALFFDLCPKNAVINELNDQLVNVYVQIKNNPQQVIYYLEIYQSIYNSGTTDDERTESYYGARDDFNSLISEHIYSAESAAILIFLNKAGFNGLYRVNSEGHYNVPSAHRKSLKAFDENNIFEVSKALQSCIIKQGDFEDGCKYVKKGDFVFFDSPYFDTFDTYQADGFTEKDHKRLARLFNKLSNRGVFCMLTNSNSEYIKDLYKNYKIEIIDVKRSINSDGSNRTGSEVIIRNY